MPQLTGLGVSGGLALGRAVVLTQQSGAVRVPIPAARVADELAALEEARARSRAQLEDIRRRVAETRGGDLAALFDAQLLMLDDPLFVGRARGLVRDEQVNAAWAVQRAYQELRDVFTSMDDPYLTEREGDIADVAGRLSMNLRSAAGQGPGDWLRDVEGPVVLVADELTPSLVAQLDWTLIRGFATDAGSRTYHTAILARSLGVPAVVGLHDASRRLRPGTLVLLDGDAGTLSIDPAPEEQAIVAVSSSGRRVVSDGRPLSPVTQDGVRITLQVNVDVLDGTDWLRECPADGVGLYRSEFLLAGRRIEDVSEEEQTEAYARLLAAAAPRPVTVRTFDVDERQSGTQAGRSRGRIGLRGIRLGLAHPELLRTQLRALVRAADAGSLRVMFPFVTSVEEFRAARAVLRDVTRECGYAGRIPVGAMIEVPAAAAAAEVFAAHADFLTVGTNDLIQYLLAVDRTDEGVSSLYQPLHPAVLGVLRMVRRAGARHQVPVSVCGEMASDPALIGLLVGLGLTDFSMTAAALPVAEAVVQHLDAAACRAMARQALSLATTAEVEQYLEDVLRAPRPAAIR